MRDSLASFHFIRPWWLLLALPALLLWRWGRQRTDDLAAWRHVIDPTLLQHLVTTPNKARRVLPIDALFVAWIIGFIAVAGPTWRLAPSPFAETARPAMLVVRVTPSMLSHDLQPTRLDRARLKIADLLEARKGAATGLVAYAGSAHLVLPPTQDSALVNTMAAALAPEVMPRQDGDDLADAVQLADRTLAEGAQGGSIVVFADAAPGKLPSFKTGAPVSLVALLPADRSRADPGLSATVSAFNGRLVTLTPDGADISALAKALAREGAPPPIAGEAPRWSEAGYWLTPLLALIALFWFRRGWVLA
jgi:Ca-activated chloride channel homolog